MRWALVAMLLCGACASQARTHQLSARLDAVSERHQRQQTERQALEAQLGELRGARLQLAERIDNAYLAYHSALGDARQQAGHTAAAVARVAQLESVLASTPILTVRELARLRRQTARAVARSSQREPLQVRLKQIPKPRVDDIAARNRAYHDLHTILDEATR